MMAGGGSGGKGRSGASGGAGGTSRGIAGGAGGSTSVQQGNYTNTYHGGGGGGGADAAGGAGAGNGGSAGTKTSPDGGNAAYGGGGGGGGGYSLAESAFSSGNTIGGSGGLGAYGYGRNGGGGGGGGGYGAVLTGLNLGANSSTIRGGAGGPGGGNSVGNGYDPFGGAAGGGGSGGAGVQLIASGSTATNNGNIQGGFGGTGGPGHVGYYSPGGAPVVGAAGGAGGAGLLASSANITNTNTIAGGRGGVGGYNLYNTGGVGGAGGAGISGDHLSIVNSGAISGGVGGNGGGIGYKYLATNLGGAGGAGGAGVAGSNLSITNGGSISGARGGGGGSYKGSGKQIGAAGTAGDAIDFTGGSNSLTLGTTTNGVTKIGTLTGNLGVTGTLTLVTPATTRLSNTIHDGSGGAGALIYDSTSTLTLASTSTYSGGTTIEAGTLDLGAPQAAGTGAITFAPAADSSSALDLETAAQNVGSTFVNTLTNFNTAGETLDLKTFAFDGIAAYASTGTSLTVTGGTGGLQSETFTLSNGALAYTAQSDGASGTLITAVPVCFLTGTLIRTARGDVAIEDLVVGDVAITAAHTKKSIRWIGKRSFDCASHRDPTMVRPIRITAGAFGGGMPYRDLLLSPHHAVAAICVGEVLVPIRLLVNGTTIAQLDDVCDITYWHVELDDHDVILANGLPAESYIDVGNRCEFEGEVSLVLYPEFSSQALAGYCRPLVMGGAVLAAIRAQLAEVAKTAGHKVGGPAAGPGFHLLVDGERIAPVVRDHHAAFVVPAGAHDLRLVSPTFSPRDLDPAVRDDRRLGLMIQAIAIDDLLGTVTDLALDNPSLVSGFHPLESGGAGTWRWTDGDALLSGSLFAGRSGSCVLRLVGRFAAPSPQCTLEERPSGVSCRLTRA